MSPGTDQPMRGMDSTEHHARDTLAWKSALSTTLADIRVSSGEEFTGSVRAQGFQGVTLNRISAGAHRTERSKRITSPDEEPCYMLCVQVLGTGAVSQAGRTALLGPGDLSVFETHEPYELSFDGEFECLGLKIPIRAISIPPGEMRSLAARGIRSDDPLAAIVSNFVGKLESGLRLLDESSQQRLIGNSVDLADALWADQLRQAEAEGPAIAIPREILRYIELNLPNPALSPAMIAQAHYMSLRKLHGLFARGELTVAAWIRLRRLERCRDDLSRLELKDLSISEIATRWGLPNPPHFSQSFRDAFGMTASEYRARMIGITRD